MLFSPQSKHCVCLWVGVDVRMFFSCHGAPGNGRARVTGLYFRLCVHVSMKPFSFPLAPLLLIKFIP